MNKYPGPSADGLYYCTNHCGKKYKSKQAISVHMRYECGVKPKFYCQECDKYFKQPVSFKAHKMNVHKYVMKFTKLYQYYIIPKINEISLKSVLITFYHFIIKNMLLFII